MRRIIRVLRRVAAGASLLLFLILLVAWFSSRSSQRVLWWGHSGPFPHYHLASLRGGKLMLAQYRETAISPMDTRFNRLVALEPRVQPWIEEYETKLKAFVSSPELHDDRSRTEAAIWQASLTESISIERWLMMHRAFYKLPESGVGSGTVSIAGPIQPLRATTQPANYADNLLRRLADGKAKVTTWQRAGISYSRGVLPYGFWRTLSVPLWLVYPLLMVLPMHSAWRYGRSIRRRIGGLCANCGYDLRASPEQCPECGALTRVKTAGGV